MQKPAPTPQPASAKAPKPVRAQKLSAALKRNMARRKAAPKPKDGAK